MKIKPCKAKREIAWMFDKLSMGTYESDTFTEDDWNTKLDFASHSGAYEQVPAFKNTFV